jgi:hypothetical protein
VPRPLWLWLFLVGVYACVRGPAIVLWWQRGCRKDNCLEPLINFFCHANTTTNIQKWVVNSSRKPLHLSPLFPHRRGHQPPAPSQRRESVPASVSPAGGVARMRSGPRMKSGGVTRRSYTRPSLTVLLPPKPLTTPRRQPTRRRQSITSRRRSSVVSRPMRGKLGSSRRHRRPQQLKRPQRLVPTPSPQLEILSPRRNSITSSSTLSYTTIATKTPQWTRILSWTGIATTKWVIMWTAICRMKRLLHLRLWQQRVRYPSPLRALQLIARLPRRLPRRDPSMSPLISPLRPS